MTVWNIWKEEAPPIDTFVKAKYKFDDNPVIVKTCRRGCCVSNWCGSLLLPSFWIPASDEEIKQTLDEWKLIPKISMKDLFVDEDNEQN